MPLLRPDIRLCAILLLIVNTRSNQNQCPVVRWDVDSTLKVKKLTAEDLTQLSSTLPDFEPRRVYSYGAAGNLNSRHNGCSNVKLGHAVCGRV